VSLSAELADNNDLLAKLTEQIVGSASSAREAAYRARSTTNLKRIGLAMHNYHDVHGHFPPAVVMGPDGKTRHSWRVELLPFIEDGGQQLYSWYKLDEPWDSENNKRVLEKMPDVFRDPADHSGSFYSSYYVLTGKGTAFDGLNGVRVRDFRDGTANTLMAVEAKRDIPWTKPEDIPYDRDKELPKFGGFRTDDGFNMLFCDGSVRFIMNSIDKELLKQLIERNDGHAPDRESLPMPPRVDAPATPLSPTAVPKK
jgi:prepilin-type processing-associated H-X9-DG protein